MRAVRATLGLPLALLFLASAVNPSSAQKTEAPQQPPEEEMSVAEGAPLSVKCMLRVEERVAWRLDGGAVPADMRAGEAARGDGGLTARLYAAAAAPHHAGRYTCRAGAGAAPGVRVRVLPRAAAAAAPRPGAPEPDAAIVVYYDVRGWNLTLNCKDLAPAGFRLVWRKNVTEVNKVLTKERYDDKDGVFLLKRMFEEDYGEYSCAAVNDAEAKDAGGTVLRRWDVRGRPHAKLPANTNVVEGQTLKLQCRLVGKPYPGVVWRYSNVSETVAINDSVPVTEERPGVTLKPNEQGVPNAELVLQDAQHADAGWYQCAPALDAEALAAGAASALPAGVLPGGAVTTLRVKDKFAALWPFLGICAEVFVLCAVILVYEKRRVKPELDDSDTDNHDQKKS